MKYNQSEFTKKINTVLKQNYIATIMLDMDDVLAQFGKNWISLYNEIYNDDLSTKDMTDWDTSKIVKEECGENIYSLLKHPGLFRFLEPSPGSQEVVQRLIDNNFDVVIVSDSPMGNPYCEFSSDKNLHANPTDDKRAWLLEHFPMIPRDNVFFGKQKFRVRGDLLVDDKPETFELFSEFGLSVLLMDQPYNQHIETEYRVKNMLEVEKKIYDMFIKREEPII